MTVLAVAGARLHRMLRGVMRSVRMIRSVGPGRALAGITGLDARPRSNSRARFRRFVFGLRFLLVPLTPLLFFVPQATYKPTETRWLAIGALVVWLIVFGALLEKEWSGVRAFSLHMLDLAVLFGLFGLSLAADSHSATAGYSGALLRGSFHPQTYGPFLTIGAMLGATRALALGAVGSIFYVLALLTAGIHPSTLVNKQQLPSLLFGIAGYFVIGGVFGLYSTLLDKLRAANERGRSRGRVLGRRQVEAEVHDKILTPIRSVQRHLARVASTLADPGSRDRVSSAAIYLDSVLRGERANRGLSGTRLQSLAEIVTTTFWSQRVFDDDQRMNELEFRPDALAVQQHLTPQLDGDSAEDLGEIVFEGIENALRHSRGPITVAVERVKQSGGIDYLVIVEDGGLLSSEQDPVGLGISNIKRRAAANGWKPNLDLGDHHSIFTLMLPDPDRRQPFRTFATSGLPLRSRDLASTLFRMGATKLLSLRVRYLRR